MDDSDVIALRSKLRSTKNSHNMCIFGGARVGKSNW